MKFRDAYLNTKTLEKMNKSDRKLFTYMYKELIKILLYPPEYGGYSKEQIDKSLQTETMNHLINTLSEYDVIVSLRELNIDKIID